MLEHIITRLFRNKPEALTNARIDLGDALGVRASFGLLTLVSGKYGAVKCNVMSTLDPSDLLDRPSLHARRVNKEVHTAFGTIETLKRLYEIRKVWAYEFMILRKGRCVHGRGLDTHAP